jgi:hypothetical protein
MHVKVLVLHYDVLRARSMAHTDLLIRLVMVRSLRMRSVRRAAVYISVVSHTPMYTYWTAVHCACSALRTFYSTATTVATCMVWPLLLLSSVTRVLWSLVVSVTWCAQSNTANHCFERSREHSLVCDLALCCLRCFVHHAARLSNRTHCFLLA